MSRERVNEQGFAVDRLDRVVQAVRRDIDAERCADVALIVARGGQVVLELPEGFADRKAGKRLGKDAVFATMSV
jgi:CubicO group peptidase (beta-lactamase class C family)